MELRVSVMDVQSWAFCVLCAPLAEMLDRAGVTVELLPRRADQPDCCEEFVLHFPDGRRLSGDVTPSLGDSDMSLFLYVSPVVGSDNLWLLAQAVVHGEDEGHHCEAEVNVAHPLLGWLGLSHLRTVSRDRVVLTDGRLLPRLTHRWGAPVVGCGRTFEHDRWWLTAAQLSALQVLPGWTAWSWEGGPVRDGEAADLFTCGNRVVVHGEEVRARGAAIIAALFT